MWTLTIQFIWTWWVPVVKWSFSSQDHSSGFRTTQCRFLHCEKGKATEMFLCSIVSFHLVMITLCSMYMLIFICLTQTSAFSCMCKLVLEHCHCNTTDHHFLIVVVVKHFIHLKSNQWRLMDQQTGVNNCRPKYVCLVTSTVLLEDLTEHVPTNLVRLAK